MGGEGSGHAGAARPEGLEGKVSSLRPPPPALGPLGSGIHTRADSEAAPIAASIRDALGGKTCEEGTGLGSDT